MFTGIVEELGEVVALDDHTTHARLTVRGPGVLDDVAIGDSIAVNGVCLTVEAVDDPKAPTSFQADLIAETMAVTALGDLAVGHPVNLERAMATGDRFGGHLVQGHVDGVGTVVARTTEPGTTWLTVAVPDALARYLVPKGSVTIDGTSLTIVDVGEHDGATTLRVGLIPHTLEVTVHGSRGVGDRVNLEVDVVAKYVERLLAAGVATPYQS